MIVAQQKPLDEIKAMIDKGIVTRGELFVTTKLWNTKHAPEDVR